MKRFTFLVALCAAFTAHAQTQKGNSFVSGSASFSHEVSGPKSAQRRTFLPQLDLNYGYFVRDNVALKVETGVLWQTYRSNMNGYRQNTLSGNVSVLGSYYFGNSQLRGFVGGGLGTSFRAANTNNSNNLITSESSQNSFYPIFEAGGIYFVNRHFALQARAQSRAMPFASASFSAGLVYWIKPQNFAVSNTNTPPTLAKGNWVVGGSFGSESNLENATNGTVKTRDQKNTTSQVRASLGKFVRDRTIVGLELGYESGSTRFTDRDFKNKNYALGVFLKQYWSPNRLTPFSSYGIKFQRNTSGGAASSNQYEANVNLGLAYLISPRFILEANLLRFNQTYTSAIGGGGYTAYSGNIRGSLSNGFTLQYVFK